MDTRRSIRNNINQRRSHLPITDSEVASRRACHHVIDSDIFQRSQHIGLYFSHNGEINPHIILETALEQGKTCYLPVLHPTKQNRLIFIQYEAGDSLIPNQYNIPEPIPSEKNLIPPMQLDLVILPLVAFDDNGNRLGMGAGYYDRSFAFLKTRDLKKPTLIGLAYEFQHIEEIKPEEWDVPLHGAATEKQLYLFSE